MALIKDLTYEIKEETMTFGPPWHSNVSITQLGSLGFDGRETRKISFGSHTGTHVDAPLHFIKDADGIDKISLDVLIGEVSIVDFTSLQENEAVSEEILRDIKITKRMLFKFGWGKHWGSKNFFRNYPFFSKEAADYLVSRDVKLIAIDTPSPDDSRIDIKGDTVGSDKDSPIHKIFLGNGIVLVEYVANLDQIDDYDGWNISVMPLKIKGADGSPARICIYK